MKKQRTFWMDEAHWKRLMQKVKKEGYEGKGKLERFMEKISDETLLFIRGDCIVEIRER